MQAVVSVSSTALCEAVCKVEQILQAQHSSVESWEGDMERLGPVSGDCIQPVVRPREASGHRGDGVRVTVEVDRRTYRVFEGGGGRCPRT